MEGFKMYSPKMTWIGQAGETPRRLTIGDGIAVPVRTLLQCAALSAFSLLMLSCDSGDGIVTPDDQENDRITITNNEGTLQGRVTRPGTTIPIDPPTLGSFPAGLVHGPGKPPSQGLTLTLEAEVAPPVVEGEVVQATSVVLNLGHKAMVSYNMRGAPRLGGLDWITKINNNPWGFGLDHEDQ
jgi:hypothetical protein